MNNTEGLHAGPFYLESVGYCGQFLRCRSLLWQQVQANVLVSIHPKPVWVFG
jgi:hypothetical protein